MLCLHQEGNTNFAMWNSCVAVKAVSGDVVAGGEKQTGGPRDSNFSFEITLKSALSPECVIPQCTKRLKTQKKIDRV